MQFVGSFEPLAYNGLYHLHTRRNSICSNLFAQSDDQGLYALSDISTTILYQDISHKIDLVFETGLEPLRPLSYNQRHRVY